MTRVRAPRGTAARGAGADGTTSFVASVGTVAAALRVGADPEAAWRRIGVRTDDGVPRAADLAALGRTGSRHVGAVRAAARLSLHLGTPAAEMLERVTIAVARDAEAEGRRRAALAGPRATARLLAWLPGAGLLLGVALGARPWDQLLGGGAGTASGLVGLVLLLAGRRWTAREVRAAERAGGGTEPDRSAGGPARRRSGAAARRRARVTALAAALPGAPALPHASTGRCPRRGGAGGRPLEPPSGRRGGRVGRLGAGSAPAARTRPGSARAVTTGPVPRWVRPAWPPHRSGAPDEAPGSDGLEGAVLLDLVDGACQSGVGVPQALDAVGVAVGGRCGADLRRAARALALGAPWDLAWQGSEVGFVARALRPAWEDGVPPGALLRAAAEAARRDRDARAGEAAARLGVRLVVPLGLCHLPAFVLVGLVPVLGSMATTTLGA